MYRAKKILPFIVTSVFLLFTVGCATIPSGNTTGHAKYYHDRVVAVGDVHGSYEGLVSILREASLVDRENRWIGGTALLVQTGDLLDRGAEVRRVMDLMMSIEHQAEKNGGRVIVLIGNHEAMNIVGSFEDVDPEACKSFAESESSAKQKGAFEIWQKYFGAASLKEGETPDAQREKWMKDHPPGFVEYTEALESDGIYGKWIRSCPAVFRYGGTVFVHGGVSREYAEISLDEINRRTVRDIEKYDKIKSLLVERNLAAPFFSIAEVTSVVEGILMAAETGDLSASLSDIVPRLKEYKTYLDGFFDNSPLMSDTGPLWFRGYATMTEEELTSFIPEWLENNRAWRVVSAHTPRRDGKIAARLDTSIFLIDTGMLSGYYKGGQPSALEIMDDDVTAVYRGEKTAFPAPVIDYGAPIIWKDEEGHPLHFDTLEDTEKYLLTAELTSTETISTGVNRPLKVSLEKDGHRINAIFRHQTVSDRPEFSSPGSRHFLDSYRGEIAAYEINRLLGMNNMAPTVYRSFDGKKGTLQLWAEGTISERDRISKDIQFPNVDEMKKQMWDMRVFDNLINNIDRNQTNILLDPNWRVILIDHTQSFARDFNLPKPNQIEKCSRGLWYALRHLDEQAARERLKPYMDKREINALFARRKSLIGMIRNLIKRNGEENVLF